ncbi:hypothetical protein L7F22_062062 [Adiantum nelumboides]|nr:hypothetical protein [Adiantum nelumboides]
MMEEVEVKVDLATSVESLVILHAIALMVVVEEEVEAMVVAMAATVATIVRLLHYVSKSTGRNLGLYPALLGVATMPWGLREKMRRAVLSSSRMVASGSKHSPQKPWYITQCHTWHALETLSPSQTDMLSISKSPLPLPLQQNPNGMEGKLSLKQQWSHFIPSFNGSVHASSLWPSLNELGSPSSQTSYYNPTIDTVDTRKTRRIVELAHLYALRERLEKETSDVVAYHDLLKMCVNMGIASSLKGAAQLVKCLDDASLVLIFHDKVYLNPSKIAQLVNEVIPTPSSLKAEQGGITEESCNLKEEKNNIDKLAYKYSRRILWLGFAYLTLQMLLIFRLTFWDLSWDVMEPIAYFVTNTTLLLGYAFFMATSKHPTYRNLSATLCSSKQNKLMKQRNFDMAKFLHIQRQCEPTYTLLRSTNGSH